MDIVVNGTGKLGLMVGHLVAEDPRHRLIGFTAAPQWCTVREVLGVPLVSHDAAVEEFPPDRVEVLSVLGGLGGSASRRDHFEAMRARGYRHASYVHPTAVVQGDPAWGVNNIVFPFATIGFDGVMGDDNIVREKVYLGHDFRVGDHCFMGVGCTLGGGLVVGDGAYLAMETTVTNDVSIAAESFVGIGSLVLADIDEAGTYYGRPARRAHGGSGS